MAQTWHIVDHHFASAFGTLYQHQADTWRLFDDHAIFAFEFAGDARAKAEPPRCSITAIAIGHRAQSEQFGGVEQSF